jgi:hypothetical protein
LTWDQPTNTSIIEGYKIYWKQDGGSYSDAAVKIIDNPSQTLCSISGLTAGSIYAFTATSFDHEDNESLPSNEVYYTVPSSETSHDTDGDGLTDEEEILYGLDPNNQDTNGNGIPDQDEVDLWGNAWDGDIDGDGTINLFDLDADGDGVCDSTEILHQKDPADPNDNPSSLPHMVFGDVSVDHNWTTVELNKTFLYPVIVAGPLSKNSAMPRGNRFLYRLFYNTSWNTPHIEPAVVRMRNITANSFEIRIQEYENIDNMHTAQDVSFLVMEMGSYYLPDGSHIEAGYFEAEANYPDFEPVPFLFNEFPEQPVLMTSISTFDNQRAVTGIVDNVSTQGFKYALQPKEYIVKEHPQELVSYIAWEVSAGELEGTQFEVTRADDIARNDQYIKFEKAFAQAPSFLASKQTSNGENSFDLRYEYKSALGLKLSTTKEQCRANGMNHFFEDTGYIALGIPAAKPQKGIRDQDFAFSSIWNRD